MVAVKVILAPDLEKKKDHVKRFQREARVVGQMETRHICQVTDTGTDPATGRPFMVMELLKGNELGELIKRVGPLDPKAAVEIAAQACHGLQKAHEAKVVHRDIKPPNIFLAEQDGDIIAKILDFGIAKVHADADWQPRSSTLTHAGALVGSPRFMSPEQARSRPDIDHRTDVYSLGVVLYYMLAGLAPFHEVESVGDLIFTICSDPAPPLQDVAPWVPAEIAEAVHRALQIEREDRFQTAQEMQQALKQLLPEGFKLSRSLLTGLNAEAKSHVALPSTRNRDRPSIGGTHTGLASTQTTAAPATSTPWLVAGAVVLVGGLGVYSMVAQDAPPEPSIIDSSTVGATPAAETTAESTVIAPSEADMAPTPEPEPEPTTAPATSVAPAKTTTAPAARKPKRTAPATKEKARSRVKPAPKAAPSATSKPSAPPKRRGGEFGGRE